MLNGDAGMSRGRWSEKTGNGGCDSFVYDGGGVRDTSFDCSAVEGRCSCVWISKAEAQAD
jgi:hypothetical protein